MHPMEIYKKIAGYATDKSKQKVLEQLSPTDEFWIIHRSVDPLYKWGQSVPIPSPKKYGPGAPEGTFRKIVTAIDSKSLSIDALRTVLDKFSETCNSTEWKEWYQPLLEGRLYLPVSWEVWNEISPPEYHIHGFKHFQRFEQYVDGLSMDGSYIEPHDDEFFERMWWVIRNKQVRIFKEDGTEAHFPAAEEALEHIVASATHTMLLDTYKDETRLFVRDVIFPDIPPLTLDQSHDMLRYTMNVFEHDHVVAMHDVQKITDVYKQANIFLEQGHDGVVIRGDAGTLRVTYNKTRKAKITGIVGDKDDCQGTLSHIMVEYQEKGKKKEIRIKVGLKASQKDIIWYQRDNFIGKKVTISYLDNGSGIPVLPKLDELEQT